MIIDESRDASSSSPPSPPSPPRPLSAAETLARALGTAPPADPAPRLPAEESTEVVTKSDAD